MPKTEEHIVWKWTSFAIIILGAWLITSPLTFSMHDKWIDISDIACGRLLVLLGARSIYSKSDWPLWAIGVVGVWLQFAPLLFWAPNPISYLNDTLIGILAITFALLVPETPGHKLTVGKDVPPGWSFNPSSWVQRFPTITLCVICWFTARYMAAYQLGYLDSIWDPFFGDGTLKVITSNLSKSFPISDAGLGALVYSLEFLVGCKGGTSRWYTMPWLTVVFGLMVIPAGTVSVLLIMSQPIIVGYWCGWCLLTALCMLFMIAFTIDEMLAVVMFLVKVRKENKKDFWKIFINGGTSADALDDTETPALDAPILQVIPFMAHGVTFPWNIIACILIGIWLMFSPPYLGLTGVPANIYQVFGALIVTFSAIATSEAVRVIRYVNILFAIALPITFFLYSEPQVTLANDIAVALLLILLSLPKGKIRQKYGAWNKYIV